jgi:hypothetical protein
MNEREQDGPPLTGEGFGAWLRSRQAELAWIGTGIRAASGSAEPPERGLCDRLESARNKLALVARAECTASRRRAVDEFRSARRALLEEASAAVRRSRRRSAQRDR